MILLQLSIIAMVFGLFVVAVVQANMEPDKYTDEERAEWTATRLKNKALKKLNKGE